MSRRTAGVIFISISAFLHATRYITAGIFGSSAQSWGEELFKSLLASVGSQLVFPANICLIAGLIYLIWAELENYFKKKDSKN